MTPYDKKDYLYTSLFCEENVWHLANKLIGQGMPADSLRVLFLSNKNKTIALFNQQAAEENKAVIWDYHVVLQLRFDNEEYIFDFDSRLPFPSLFDEYFFNTLPSPTNTPDDLKTAIRTIPAESYLKYFYSDRSHMKDIISDNEYPDYPIIKPDVKNIAISLFDYWDMEKELDDGSVVCSSLD
jgi:protein N-terminal glutamine amidohydrolase